MELRHLRYFITVAEELHFGKAATRLNMSQPPLSQQIRQLEEELGFPLLYRNKQHVKLTEAGKVFLEEVRIAIAQVEQACLVAQKANQGLLGRLSIGFVGSSTYSVAPLLHRFLLHSPKINITLHQMKTANQLHALHEGSIHLGIVRTHIHSPNIVSEVICSEKFVAIFPEGHPMTQREALRMIDLENERFILTTRGSTYHDTVIHLCYQAGFSPNIALELPEILTIMAFVSQGMGVSIVPASFRHQQNKGIVYRELADVTSTLETYFVWRSEEKSKVLQEFIKLSKDNTILD
ncbi:LysR substrate-binding domain-containing protein [Paenibacillus sp.]|uniref:LysR substrate-binding domain-containing protein n=1 Tax=Paenibacillus sp. TaxID=58172 RepID=UPI00356B4D12